jgi:threonine dehydratase
LPDHIPDAATILEAAERIEPYIHRTPLMVCQTFDRMANARLIFKCENFQKAGAFKSRGACNAVFSMPAKIISKGVATHSSGNHAQALSRAAALRNIPAEIVMPENSSAVKIAAVQTYGGKITFCPPTLQAREETLKKVIEKTGATEIHPYDNYDIIAGQASCCLEILRENTNPDIIVAPVGGGGLLSGTAISADIFGKNIKVYGAEPAGADDAFQSFRTKKFVPSIQPETIADGLRTSLGLKTMPLIFSFVEDILTVSEHSIIHTMKLIWERMKIVVEPSAATALAAVFDYPELFRNKKVAVIFSGGNADLQSLPWVKPL